MSSSSILLENSIGVAALKQILGNQLIVELFDCDQESLKDVSTVEAVLLKAANAAKATVINHCFHQFSPHGVSGVVVIAESHIAVHTWPEHRYCAIDIFTCGDLIDNDSALTVLKEGLRCESIKVFKVKRGPGNRSLNSLPLEAQEVAPL